MKNIYLYSLMLLSIIITSCNPLEDTYNELEIGSQSYKKQFSKTLSEEDYKSITGAPSSVTRDYYFASQEQAALIIPVFLNKKYPQLDDASVVTVSYNQLVFRFTNNNIANNISYTLSNSDYALGGTNFQNFDKFSQIETFLKAKYPEAVDGALVNLTFVYFNSQVLPTSSTITDTFYFKNGKWYDTYLVSNADYASVDRSRFNNFSASAGDEEALNGYFDKFLKSKYSGAKVNDVVYVSYVYRVSSNVQTVRAMRFDGINWTEVKSNILEEATLNFKKKDGIWAPDLAIRYTLVIADYQYIALSSTAGTQDTRDNLKQFNNFFTRTVGDTRYWSPEAIQEALNQLLKFKFPNQSVGQKYEITYSVFNGSALVLQTVLELKGNGNWELAD